MTSDQPLRPYVVAAASALGVYVLLNIAIYWLWVRPDASPPAAPALSPVAESAAAPPASAAQAGQVAQPPALELFPAAGDWVQENGVIVQRSTQPADLFAGSNLSGEQYTASTDVLWPPQAGGDMGGGLIFHMQSPNELAGAQMVRFHRNGQEVLWGYFNEQGAFQGEGGAAVSLEGGKPHTLAIVVKETTFDFLVDGVVAATELPLHGQGGGIGLIAYGGPITFSNLQMDANGVVAPSNQ